MKLNIYIKSLCLSSVVALISCTEELRVYEPDVVGLSEQELVLGCAAGVSKVEFYANRPGSVSILSGADWVDIDRYSFDESGTLNLEYRDNESYPRMAEVVFALNDYPWSDTLRVKQKGMLSDDFELPNTSVLAFNGTDGGYVETPIITELPSDAFDFSVAYDPVEEGDWISSVEVVKNNVRISLSDNPDSRNVRTAVVTVSHLSGWGLTTSVKLNLTQANSRNEFGEKVSISDLKSLASEDGEEVAEDCFMEGYIVSEVSTLNLGDNPLITSVKIDYEACRKIVYVESVDGHYGVMLETATIEDNVFQNNTLVQVRLKGTTAFRYSEPDRLVISGVRSAMVMKSEKVDPAVIPVKNRRIRDLTDDDLYTRVTLTDVELPVRKGGLTPIHDGYTNAAGAHRISKFPLLVRCVDGGSMYMYTNTTCPYRRDGRKPGDGSGMITGIIVHELYLPFQDGDNPVMELCGNIGRYQIRHMAFEDINLAKSFDNSFSGLIAEWRYMQSGENSGNKMPATKGTGYLDHTYSGIKCDTDANYKTFKLRMYKAVNDFSYLGPCGTDSQFPFGENKGNVNGLGIYLDDGTDYGAGDSAMNKEGTGIGQGRGYGWAADHWWDNKADSPYSWLVEFSTKDIVTDHLSIQLSMMNLSQSCLTPHNWMLEYMFEGEGQDWKKVAEFTVPDIVIWNNTLQSQSAGYKGMDFPLPLEILDKDKVYVRISPVSKIASDGKAYANAKWSYAAGRRCCMNYCAIRYNK